MTGCRVVFDATRCSGIGLCEAAMPAVFQVDADGRLQVAQAEFAIERLQELQDLVLACPTQSLSVAIID